MSRALSVDFLKACYAANSNFILTTLIEIVHPDLVVPFRFHNKIYPLTSNSNEYESRWFQMALPPELNDSVPEITLTIDNADLYISLATFALDTRKPYDVYMSIVDKRNPDVIEYGVNRFTAPELACDDVSAVFNCTLEQGLASTWPKDAQTPYSNPGIFGTFN